MRISTQNNEEPKIYLVFQVIYMNPPEKQFLEASLTSIVLLSLGKSMMFHGYTLRLVYHYQVDSGQAHKSVD